MRAQSRVWWPVLMLAVTVVAPLGGQAATEAPTPESVIGWQPGADYKLADYGQIMDYFERLAAASDRLVLERIGETAMGKPMMLAIISSESNLAELDRWKQISRRLAMGDADEAEAWRLAEEGRAIIWIDGGLHATEVAHAQHTPLLAHHLVTSESDEVRQIRDETVVLLMPVMNPDGLDIVADWYRSNLGTEFETAPLPELYHKYVGHDNNRDWFMILQPETRAVTRQLWHEWYPQIVYNHHQTGPFPSRIFVPPFTDPMNPHIPPLVMRGINLVGSAMSLRFDREDKPGVVSRAQYSVWWNGGMRTAPYFHNQIGILTETNLYRYATPHYYPPEELPPYVGSRRGGAISSTEPSVFYPNPWRGGWWRIGDAVDYMMTGSMAVADIGAELKEDWLYNMWLMARRAVEAGESGGPFAYIIPAEQHDASAADAMVEVLRRGAVEVHRATSDFRAGGATYPAGSYIGFAAQPFRAHLMDLLEPQRYPDRRQYPGGPPDPPYDLAGWTLPIQMGVDVDRIDEPFRARTEPVRDLEVRFAEAGVRGTGDVYLLSPTQNAAFIAVNRLLSEGADVSRTASALDAAGRTWPAGTYVIEADRRRLEALATEHGLEFVGAAEPGRLLALSHPRVGLYKSWVANMDEGWTRWLLEEYGIRFDTLDDEDIRRGGLDDYDAILLPDQDAEEILRGHAEGTMPSRYTGGVGAVGAANLARWVEEGGMLVAMDHAADFAIDQLGLPVRNVLTGIDQDRFFIPGSLIRITVDETDPIGFGMQSDAAAFFVRSQAFELIPPASEGDRRGVREGAVVARYADDDLLLSGWELGAQRYLAGQAAALRVPKGQGNVVLLGFRTQFRGQPHNTFKLLFNSILASTIESLPTPVVTEDVTEAGGGR